MSSLDKELVKIINTNYPGQKQPILKKHTTTWYNRQRAIAQIKQTILKELKKNKPKEEDMGEPGSYNVGYNSALDDFEAVLDKVLGGKE